MTIPINQSGEIAAILSAYTTNITGSIFLSLASITMVLIIICLWIGIDINWTTVVMYPLMIATASWSHEYLQILAIFILYSAFIIANNWLFR